MNLNKGMIGLLASIAGATASRQSVESRGRFYGQSKEAAEAAISRANARRERRETNRRIDHRWAVINNPIDIHNKFALNDKTLTALERIK